MLLVSVSVPTLSMPPPWESEVFPVTVQLVTVSVPLLSMPPPSPVILPFSMVRPEIKTVAPESTRKITELLSPLIARLDAPGPAIFTGC